MERKCRGDYNYFQGGKLLRPLCQMAAHHPHQPHQPGRSSTPRPGRGAGGATTGTGGAALPSCPVD